MDRFFSAWSITHQDSNTETASYPLTRNADWSPQISKMFSARILESYKRSERCVQPDEISTKHGWRVFFTCSGWVWLARAQNVESAVLAIRYGASCQLECTTASHSSRSNDWPITIDQKPQSHVGVPRARERPSQAFVVIPRRKEIASRRTNDEGRQ